MTFGAPKRSIRKREWATLSKKDFLTDDDEAGMLAKFLATPYDSVHQWRKERRTTRFELAKRFPGLRPDQHQGNHTYEDDMKVLETEIHLMDVALSAMEPIRARVGRIEAKPLRHGSLAQTLSEVYDVYASELTKCGQPLTEPLLIDSIPGLVFNIAVDKGWLPYRLFRPRKNGIAKDFLSGWRRPLAMKKKGAAELFHSYTVPKGFGDWFKAHFENRAAYWRRASRREAPTSAQVEQPTSPSTSGILDERSAAKAHPTNVAALKKWRAALLKVYRDVTGQSEYSTYEMPGGSLRPHTIHKPEFRKWKRGALPSTPRTIRYEDWLIDEIQKSGGSEKLKSILPLRPTHSRQN